MDSTQSLDNPALDNPALDEPAVDEPSRHRALGSPTRATILDLLRQSPRGLTARDVSEHTGLFYTTVREHLDRLTSVGLVTRERDRLGRPGRPAWRYRPAPEARNPQPADPILHGIVEALVSYAATTADTPSEAGMRAGEPWGRRLADGHGDPLSTLVTVLDDLGFDPQPCVGGDSTVVHLRDCPFVRALPPGTTAPELVCGLHLGVIRGVLDQRGAADHEVRVEPAGLRASCTVSIRHPRGAGAAG